MADPTTSDPTASSHSSEQPAFPFDLSSPRARGRAGERRQTDLGRALTLAKWTDSRFLDPLIGLVLPGIGDVLGAAAGLYIVAIAVRHGVPRTIVARMLVNLSIDCVGGVIPIVGDLFDALNRANLRNARLLQQHLIGPTRTVAPLRPGMMALPIAMLVAAVAIVVGLVFLVASRWRR